MHDGIWEDDTFMGKVSKCGFKASQREVVISFEPGHRPFSQKRAKN